MSQEANCLHFKQCQGLGFIDSSHPHQSGGFPPHSSTILHTCSKYSSKASIVTGAGVLEDDKAVGAVEASVRARQWTMDGKAEEREASLPTPETDPALLAELAISCTREASSTARGWRWGAPASAPAAMAARHFLTDDRGGRLRA